jgi:integrase
MRSIRRNGLPKYCSWNADRDGNRFVRFRLDALDLYLKGTLFTETWWKQYSDALQGIEPDRNNTPSPARIVPGSMNDLAQAYLRSPGFKDLKLSTQTTRRNIIIAFCKEHGNKPVNLLARRHIADIIGAKADTPMAANNLLKCLRYLLDLAVERDMIAANPAIGVKLYRSKSEGHHTWSEAEVIAFENRYPVGSRARLALSLLLFTAQRRGDVVRMGRQDIRGDQIAVRQEKTSEPLLIPLHPYLKQVLDALPKKNMTFLMTEQGAPFTSNGFGNWFRDRCDESGLPQCSAHGLRKLATVRLVEAGCTNEQIRAITGHRSDSSLRAYTRKADQAKLARQAVATLVAAEREQKLSSDAIALDKTGTK